MKIPSKTSRPPRSNWSVQEMLCLVKAKKESLDEEPTLEWLMQGPAHRAPFSKWQAVAFACSKNGVKKNHTQCLVKWKRLLHPWRAIFLRGNDYWVMSREDRKAAGLPLTFNRKIFNAIRDAFHRSDDSSKQIVPYKQEVQYSKQGQRRPKQELQRPNREPHKDIKGEAKSSIIDVDAEELPSVDIEEKEQKLLQVKHEKGVLGTGQELSLSICGARSSIEKPIESRERALTRSTNSNKEQVTIPCNEYYMDTLHSQVAAETSQGPKATTVNDDKGQQASLFSQENHVEENHGERNATVIEPNARPECACSANLRLDKETIGKFLESISSMAKVMEVIVRALTR